MSKNFFITGLLLFVSFTGLQAQTIIDQGTCGDSLTWVLTSDSTLTINGSGAMDDYINHSNTPPWYSYRTGIATVILGDSVTSIGNFAFRLCSITSVSIPNSVTTIGNSAFGSCGRLASITIPNSVTTIGDYAFSVCGLTSVTIPNSITTIKSGTFYHCSSLISVTIPNSIITIGYAAFADGGLTSVIIPNSVTTIGDDAFANCNLTSVTIGDSVTTIGDYAFSVCPFTSVIIPSSVTTIGDYAFSVCGLTSVIIPNSVTTIKSGTFYRCSSLTSVTIPNSVITIGNSAFASCGLTSVTIGDSVTTIESNAFTACPFTSIIIPNSVTTIGDYAFSSCGLTSVTIPNSVITIGDRAFLDCTSLTSVTIPNSVTTIGYLAFYGCTNLNFIICESIIPPIILEYTFENASASIPVFVPCNSMNAYQTAEHWKVFTNFIGMSDTTFIFDTTCQRTVYNGNGFIVTDGAGMYYRTVTTTNNCDSVICLALLEYEVTPVIHYSTAICQGNTYSDSNFTNLTQTGNYYDTLQNVNGCDSIVHLYLEVTMISLTDYSATICQDSAYSDVNFTNLMQTGNYYDTLQSVNGCDSIIHLYLEVTIVSVPVNLTAIQVNNHFSITWQGNAASYELYRNDTLLVLFYAITSYLDTNLLERVNYCYEIKAIDGDCESELSEEVCLTFNHTGITEQQTGTFSVYPNPTHGQLTIYHGQLRIDKVEIFDVIGRIQKTTTATNKQSGEIIIDISHLSAGIYYLRVFSEKNITKKIVKN
jgi:hypothetical protein